MNAIPLRGKADLGVPEQGDAAGEALGGIGQGLSASPPLHLLLPGHRGAGVAAEQGGGEGDRLHQERHVPLREAGDGALVPFDIQRHAQTGRQRRGGEDAAGLAAERADQRGLADAARSLSADQVRRGRRAPCDPFGAPPLVPPHRGAEIADAGYQGRACSMCTAKAAAAGNGAPLPGGRTPWPC